MFNILSGGTRLPHNSLFINIAYFLVGLEADLLWMPFVVRGTVTSLGR